MNKENFGIYREALNILIDHFGDRLKNLNHQKSTVWSAKYKDEKWQFVTFFCQIDNDIKYVNVFTDTGAVDEGNTLFTVEK